MAKKLGSRKWESEQTGGAHIMPRSEDLRPILNNSDGTLESCKYCIIAQYVWAAPQVQHKLGVAQLVFRPGRA